MRAWFRFIAWFVVVVGGTLAILFSTVLELWTIPLDDPRHNASLAPSLAGGDTVILMRGKGAQGDLVRCLDPDEPRRFVVARLFAEGGDKISFPGDEVLVNSTKTDRISGCLEPHLTIKDPMNGDPLDLVCGLEAFHGIKHDRAGSPKGPRPSSGKLTPYEVPAGKAYIVSDDRAYPLDSREYGPVSRDGCHGAIFFRVSSALGLSDRTRRFEYVH